MLSSTITSAETENPHMMPPQAHREEEYAQSVVFPFHRDRDGSGRHGSFCGMLPQK